MDRRAVAAVEIDPKGRLLVRPEAESVAAYEYIYREANGLRWDRERCSFCAYEPDRWEPVELMKHLVATVGDAYNERLFITNSTAWVCVPPELERELRVVLAEGLQP